MLLLTALLAVAAPLPEPKPANERYGDAVVAILKGATRLEVVRINRPVQELLAPVQAGFDGYPVAEVAPEQGEKQALAVGKVILEDAQKPIPKPVNFFQPCLGFRLWKNRENVEILFDPETHNLQVIGHDANGKILKQTLNVARPATFNALLKLGQTAFPDDGLLRQVKEAEEK